MSYLQDIRNDKQKEVGKMEKVYRSTGKPFSAFHLWEDKFSDGATKRVGGKITKLQYSQFEENFLRPHQYTSTQVIPIDQLLEYALIRTQCFIRWLVKHGYYMEYTVDPKEPFKPNGFQTNAVDDLFDFCWNKGSWNTKHICKEWIIARIKER